MCVMRKWENYGGGGERVEAFTPAIIGNVSLRKFQRSSHMGAYEQRVTRRHPPSLAHTSTSSHSNSSWYGLPAITIFSLRVMFVRLPTKTWPASKRRARGSEVRSSNPKKTCVRVRVRQCVYVYMRVCVFVCVYVYIRVCVFACVHVCV